MIKEAIEYLLNKVSYEIREINGTTYHINNSNFEEITRPTITSLTVNSLTSLIDYIKEQPDEFSTENMILQVETHTRVNLFGSLKGGVRDDYIMAIASVPTIGFGQFYDLENFNVMLQSCFEKTDDVLKLLQLVCNIKEETIKNTSDDGTTQRVVAKTGIAIIEEIAVPNPVLLVPFRTFPEVEQPESKFVFRLQNGPRAALFEADAGAWKLKAMQSIKEYLQSRIKNPNIKILA